MKKYFLFIIIVLTSLQLNFAQTNKRVIFTDKAPKPIGPYSQAILAGNTLYLSGQIALDKATGKIAEGDIKAEAKQVLDNIKSVLEEAGYSMKDIVKTTIYLSDMENFNPVNKVYATYFDGYFPARETVQVAGLPMKARVEISVIAVK